MSRSIHSTHRDLREARLRSYRDDKIKAAELAEIEKDLSLKRTIKDAVLGARSAEEVVKPEGLAGPIPIRILDEGPKILHPATPEDIQAVQRRLPAGILEGVSEIVLSLGEHVQAEGENAHIWDPDPISNRIGLEILPGFYKGWIWGTYESFACRITLHSFVFDPARPCPMPTKAYFKLQVLSTFVHEAAHHFDHTRRTARGRWLALEGTKVEHFAEHRQHEWTQACVVPYLEETYPQDVAELLQWLEVHGKIRFTLGELISDPRQAYVSTIERALENLLTDVMKETTVLEKLFNFAVNLKIADRFERAQQVVDHILADAPEHDEALELRADIWNFQKNYADSALLASQLVARNPRHRRAQATLIRAYEGLGQWAKVIETATESLALFEDELHRLDAIASRSTAYWKLGKQEQSDDDLKTLQRSQRAPWWIKRILRERLRAAQ
jgi:hypothetical protein